ncbi:MAG: hypothetical protein AAF485_29250, partial [Chloroflexota bacterium]
QGVLEVEGSETFVKTIYTDFKTHFVGIELDETALLPPRRRRKSKPAPAATEETTPPVSEAAPNATTSKSKSKPKSSPYTYLKDLNLRATENHASLVEFMDSKFPLTNEERNIVFLYYLQNTLKLKPITADHIYTCYRAAKLRVPLSLDNSLQITLNGKGWIRMTKTGNITLTAAGKKYVEKQLPKKVKS